MLCLLRYGTANGWVDNLGAPVDISALPGWAAFTGIPVNGYSLEVNLETGEFSLISAAAVLKSLVYIPLHTS